MTTVELSNKSDAMRRRVLMSGAGMAAALGLVSSIDSAEAGSASPGMTQKKSNPGTTGTIATKDGSSIFYKDWGGTGTPVVFAHGWPLSADAWDAQMLFFGERGHRVIAHDRRGHGRSSQPWSGNDMDTYADDLAALMDALEIKGAMMVGHSTGGGEVVRYLGRHGSKRIARAVLVGAVPPVMAKSADNPNGAPMEVFDGLRAGVRADQAQLFRDLSAPFFGTNRPNAKPLQGLRDAFWLQGMMGGHKSLYDCIKAFSETNFTEDLKKITVPILLIHGDDDQIVPIDLTARISVKLIRNASLKVYPGAPHGLPWTHQDMFNNDLLNFLNT